MDMSQLTAGDATAGQASCSRMCIIFCQCIPPHCSPRLLMNLPSTAHLCCVACKLGLHVFVLAGIGFRGRPLPPGPLAGTQETPAGSRQCQGTTAAIRLPNTSARGCNAPCLCVPPADQIISSQVCSYRGSTCTNNIWNVPEHPAAASGRAHSLVDGMWCVVDREGCLILLPACEV